MHIYEPPNVPFSGTVAAGTRERNTPFPTEHGQVVRVDKLTRGELGIAEQLADQTVWDIRDYHGFRIGFIWIGGWRGQKVLVAEMPPEAVVPETEHWLTIVSGSSEELDSLEGVFEVALWKSVRKDRRESAAPTDVSVITQ